MPFFHAPSTNYADFADLARKDKSAEDRFFRIYGPAVDQWIGECGRAKKLRHHDGEDLTQSILLALFQTARKVGPSGETGAKRFRRTAYTIARNKLVDYIREKAVARRVRALTDADLGALEAQLSAAGDGYAQHAAECVARVRDRYLSAGKARDWAVYQARVETPADYVAIARDHQISEDNARQIVSRVRADLRAEYEQSQSSRTT